MKIEIFKKENDENVYYTIDKENESRLNFDSIKEISKMFLEKKQKGDDTGYEISVGTPDLDLYKTTIAEVINGILEDDELLQLYTENQKHVEKENADNLSNLD